MLAQGKDPRPWEARPTRKSVGAQASWGVRFSTQPEVDKFAQELGLVGRECTDVRLY